MTKNLFTQRSGAAESGVTGAKEKALIAPPASLPFPELFATDDAGEFILDGQQPPAASELAAPLREIEQTSPLESMPHLLRQIVDKWGTRDFNTFVHQLFLDTRDGSRKGFSFEVVRELNFLVELNLLVRAQAAAPLLNVALNEACKLIAQGDLIALGHTAPSADVWSSHVGGKEKTRSFHASPLAKAFHAHHPHSPGNVKSPAKSANGVHTKPSGKVATILNEAPPVPPCVRVDLTAPRPLRTTADLSDTEWLMEWGFFRCLSKELSGLKVKRLMLSNLGDAARCGWLSAAVRFCKKNCEIPEVVLHADLLTSSNEQLAAAMENGLDVLVINLNIASGRWRTQAEEATKSNPGYFKERLLWLLRWRDEFSVAGGKRCLISVIEVGRRDTHLLHLALSQLTRLPGISPFHWEPDEDSKALVKDRHHHGDCHCWAPFIEAHVRTSGHLVACAQDYTGNSLIADLKQVTFTDAWLSQAFRKTRHRVLLGDNPGTQCEICHHRAASA